MATSDSLYLGDPRVNKTSGATCCGKPRGCTMTHDGCLFLSHPWKRAMVFGDTSARCQATCIRDGQPMQCTLNHGHEGVCELGPRHG